MSSITRRQVLVSSAMVGLSAGMVATARANVAETFLQSCPHCSANLAMGDLHKPGCIAVQAAAPADTEIKPETIKTVQAQRRSTDSPRGCWTKKEPYGPPDPCPERGCDRCKVQSSNKGVITCYWKNKEQCHWLKTC